MRSQTGRNIVGSLIVQPLHPQAIYLLRALPSPAHRFSKTWEQRGQNVAYGWPTGPAAMVYRSQHIQSHSIGFAVV